MSAGRAGNAFWVCLSASGVRLGGVLGEFGVSRVGLGGFLASLGSFLGDFWEHFSKIFCHLEQYAKIAKNLGKTMVFH